MGKWQYRKPEASTERGLCIKCGRNPQKSRGSGTYRALCSSCDKKIFSPNSRQKGFHNKDKKRRPYRAHVKGRCERCNFKPEHICQLDVDHIDGNHQNNTPDNLQTLCANCHRLKTYRERKPRSG